ncbi:hypothetical protein F1188_20235 [Roseospira marina]|uniref:Uncharacterized protein n=1 Tax=Roseospira marina TaxID=140057 RepID=A0A5M6I4T2_9PROT|nr:hypothetical protein [Roseospira marina]KAA5602809.1 hypothetical protein F1188_20235 [Roseospira marina]MBB4316238.1 hypothetical protein [Roseospira marina]MBB5089420.1 hypothetical protein [Roseospira marina]
MSAILRALLGRLGRVVLAAGAALLALVWIRRDAARDARREGHAKTLKETADAQGRMLDAAGDRPRDRDTLARRLRDGRF